ncbi:MAG TPA: sigma-70 family RNA polymerase sigma factor [Pseudobacter sp.]|jgi:RNA polymerase sigma-70 factor (ECF subfamily)|nr:sigma-70 family RNA polymerase sigma factor [Pseudobacter sp.]
MNPNEDLELFEKVKQDDIPSFNLLFNKYWEKLYVFVYKKLQSEDDAKDIIQNVFIAVWIKRCQIDIQTTLENYLFSVTRYHLLSFITQSIRSRQKQDLLLYTVLPGFEETLTPKQAQQLDLLLQEEVDKLPNRMKQIFRMTLDQNLSVREISLQLHLSEQSVRNQLNAAISKVKLGLGESVLLAIFLGQF